MAIVESIVSEIQSLSSSDWINVASFFATPAIVTWVLPTRRMFVVAVVASTLFWIGLCVWTQQPLDFSAVSTAIIAVLLVALCFAILGLRRIFPPAKTSDVEGVARDN
jgi:hypothetical protein